MSSGLRRGTATVSDAQLPKAEYYRQTAEARFPEIGEELFQLADRFDLMAAHLKRRANAR
jgi:hypothetical protein